MENVLGSINIDRNAVAQIAYQSVLECYGVVGFGYKSKTSNIVELLKGEVATSKGVKVDLDKNDVKLEVYIIVQYGTNIATVSKNIVEKIKYNIETMTELNVSNIVVNVQGVRNK